MAINQYTKPEREWMFTEDTNQLMSRNFHINGKPYDAPDYGILKNGANEINHDDDIFISWYNAFMGTNFNMNVGWCAIFASWCIGQTGKLVKSIKDVHSDFVYPAFSNGDNGLSMYVKLGRFTNSKSYIPQRGDIIFLTNKANRDSRRMSTISDTLYKPTHVGIVVRINEAENYVTTIEGNCSDRVKLVNRYLINPNIVGFGY